MWNDTEVRYGIEIMYGYSLLALLTWRVLRSGD